MTHDAAPAAEAAPPDAGARWVTCWATALNGVAGPSPQQPDLLQAFPDRTWHAQDQSFRMILRPSLTGTVYRFRISNLYGDQPLRIERATLGLQAAAGALVPGSVRPASFSGAPGVTVAAGQSVYSDAVPLPAAGAGAYTNLAVSFHIARPSGALSWHADAFTISYITAPSAGDRTEDESELAFAYATSSWLLVDALDVRADPGAAAIVALGDSITDGWITTMNGHDRWTDVLARRLSAAYPGRFAVVNQGLCGNQVAAGNPTNPSALARFERDVAGLEGIGAVILFAGTNDLASGIPAAPVIAAMEEIAAKAHGAGYRIFAATILPRTAAAVPAELEEARLLAAWHRVNDFIRSSRVFDGVIDFAALLGEPDDPEHLAPAFIPNASGAGDGLHPNRLANLRMGEAVPLSLFDPVRAGGV